MNSNNLTNDSLLVADTSPLLALARVDSLQCLSRLFSRVCVTQSVLAECLVKQERADALAVQAALEAGWLLAKRKGLLAEIKPKLYEMIASGYFLSDSLVARLLELAHE